MSICGGKIYERDHEDHHSLWLPPSLERRSFLPFPVSGASHQVGFVIPTCTKGIHPSSPPGDDFSPVNLQKVSDEIRFDLYDEVVVDLLQVRAGHLVLYIASIYMYNLL